MSTNTETVLTMDDREHRRNVARERILMARQKQRSMNSSKQASKLQETTDQNAKHGAEQTHTNNQKEAVRKSQQRQHVCNLLSTPQPDQAFTCGDDADQLTCSKTKEETSDDKLQRLVCMENLPPDLNEEDLVAEFAKHGAIESVCLEFRPFMIVGDLDSENMKEPLHSCVKYRRNIYVVYEKRESTRYACSHAFEECGGEHDCVGETLPSKVSAEDSSIERAFAHTLCISNLPYDVEGEEILKLFCHNAHVATEVYAVRLIRDLQTSAGNGFSFLLFKSKIASKHALKQGPLRLRGKTLKVRYLYRPSFVRTTPNQVLWSMILLSSLELKSLKPDCGNTKLNLCDPLKGDPQTNATNFLDLGATWDSSSVGIVVNVSSQANAIETCKTRRNEGEKQKKEVGEKSKRKGSGGKTSKRKRSAIDKANTLNLQRARTTKEQSKTS